MKHLKRINEAKQSDVEAFCKMYLSYLIDELDFDINISLLGNSYMIKITFPEPKFIRYKGSSNLKLSNEGKVTWPMVRDEFIPFIQAIHREWGINGSYVASSPTVHFKCIRNTANNTRDYYNTYYTVDELSRDEVTIGPGIRIMCISFLVKR